MPEIFGDKYICVVCKKKESKFRCGRCHSVTYCGKECQKKDLKRHKKVCAPVVYKALDSRGRGLMATKCFKQGDLIYKEKAAMSVKYENRQSKIERGLHISKEFLNLPEEEQKRFLILKSEERAIDLLQDELKNYSDDDEKVKMIKSNFLVIGIFENNHFQIMAKNDKIVFWDNIFLTMCSTTHSCVPNAEVKTCEDDPQAVEIRAKTNIKEGEEITINHLLISNLTDDLKYFTRSQRHEYIKAKDFSCLCPKSLVISGDGNSHGQCLGLYEWDPTLKCYKQFNTEPFWHLGESTDKFLYKTESGSWIIGVRPGIAMGWLYNDSKSFLIPRRGWMNMDTWKIDHSVKIEFRELSAQDVGDKISITLRGQAAKQWPECGGEFVKTRKYYSGKPIFINNHGYYLFSDDMEGWSIGEEMFRSRVWSTSAGLSPASSKSWNLDGDVVADVAVMEVLD